MSANTSHRSDNWKADGSDVVTTESRLAEMRSDRGMSFKTADGDSVAVRIKDNGTISLASMLKNDHGGLGSFEISGLDPEVVAAKKKSFWRGLWDAIKSAAATVLDAVTVPVFGYRCRPNIDIDLGGGSIVIGISCKEA